MKYIELYKEISISVCFPLQCFIITFPVMSTISICFVNVAVVTVIAQLPDWDKYLRFAFFYFVKYLYSIVVSGGVMPL